MEFREFIRLNNGTKIMFSRLKYSGVYFRCETPRGVENEGEKHAMTIWPDDIEPQRFFDIKGYTADEIEELRFHINKVGNLVLSWVKEELEEEVNKAKEGLLAGNMLLIFDRSLGGFVDGFINAGGGVQRLLTQTDKLGLLGDILLYNKDCEVEIILNTVQEVVKIKRKSGELRCYLKNVGEEWLDICYEKQIYSVESNRSIKLW